MTAMAVVDGVTEVGSIFDRAEAEGVPVGALAYWEAMALGGQIVAGAARVASVTAAWVEMVGVFDARGGHGHSDFESTAKWLAWACSMSHGTAREHVRVARGLQRMPVIAGAFARGEVSYSKVRECTRIVGLIDEEVLLKRARDFTAEQLERAVRGFKAGRTDRLVAEQRRGFSHRVLPDGGVQLTAILAPEEAAVLLAALDVATTRYRSQAAAARDAAAPTLDDALDGVPAGTRAAPPQGADDEAEWVPSYTRADALIDVARGFIDSGPADESGEDRDIVVVHVDAADLAAAELQTAGLGPADPSEGAGRVPAGTWSGAWIEGVGAVHASTAARIGCTGIVQTVLGGTDGEVLRMGREQRLATKKQKRALMARDRHCRFPGCIRAVRLHAHHILSWLLLGPTDTENLILLCQQHHVMVHAAGITITKRRGRPGYDFTRIGGEPITAQRPDEYSPPAPCDRDLRPLNEAILLRVLVSDASRLDPDPDDQGNDTATAREAAGPDGRPYPPAAAPGWQLPEPMSDLGDVENIYDPRGTIRPRWAGALVREGDYYDLMEYRATTPRTNPHARY